MDGQANDEADRERRSPAGPAVPEAGGHAGAIPAMSDGLLLRRCPPDLETAPDPLNGEFGNFGAGRYGWVLDSVVPLNPPVPWRGNQGLWEVPDKLHGWVYGAMARGWDMIGEPKGAKTA